MRQNARVGSVTWRHPIIAGGDRPIVPRFGQCRRVIRIVGGSSMTHFVGLDVSQKITAICVVDDAGRRTLAL
jgi:hypothetical protein